MNKTDLIEAVSRVTCAKKEAGDAVNAVIGNIISALKSGDKVTLTGLGTFSTRKRKAKVGRNPKSGEAIQIPPKKVVKFKPARDVLK